MNQVIEKYGLSVEIEHANLDGVPGFGGDGIFTLSDVTAELKAECPKRYIMGIQNMADKVNLLKEIRMLLKTEGDK